MRVGQDRGGCHVGGGRLLFENHLHRVSLPVEHELHVELGVATGSDLKIEKKINEFTLDDFHAGQDLT